MNRDGTISFDQYLDVIWRHRIAAICAFVTGVSLTALAFIILPRTYSSSAVLALSPSQVPLQYIPPSAQAVDFKSRAWRLQNEVVNPATLEPLVRRYSLYQHLRGRGMSTGELARRMVKSVHIEVTADEDWNKAHWGSIRVSYDYADLKVAKAVTGALVKLIIQSDLAEQKSQASAATKFLRYELDRSETALNQQTAEIKAFKDRYQGSLPEDLDLNLKSLSSFQAELEQTTTALSTLEERRMELDQRIALAQQQTVSLRSNAGQASWPSPEAALSSLETQLAVLKAQYREDYPDVVSLKAQIAALKEQFGESARGGLQQQTPLDQELLKQHESLGGNEERLRGRISSLDQQIARVRERIRDTPVHEQQLALLTRDYAVLTDQYHDLLQKVLNAGIYENLVARGDGERLNVVEPPTLPSEPIFPKPGALLGVGLALSLFAGLGLPFALYFMDSSLKQAEELHSLNLPVLAVISSEGQTGRSTFVPAILYSIMCLLTGATILLVWSSML